MNIGFWSCIIWAIPSVIIGVLFAIFKEKAAKFVLGGMCDKLEFTLTNIFQTLYDYQSGLL